MLTQAEYGSFEDEPGLRSHMYIREYKSRRGIISFCLVHRNHNSNSHFGFIIDIGNERRFLLQHAKIGYSLSSHYINLVGGFLPWTNK
ncbi:unnamed protein product [Hermetia illucens]|uniref:Uncharacterized protein n=1 Tax=Hermetia illucens TaxID=343691 RepID=A0A7R8UZ29_HERIL|nr:unnamed protein product [Hermetia illucens]